MLAPHKLQVVLTLRLSYKAHTVCSRNVQTREGCDFGRTIGDWGMVGLDDLADLFQPWQFSDSKTLQSWSIQK